jgi:diguanylate cyclase (GGDEF)-like protein
MAQTQTPGLPSRDVALAGAATAFSESDASPASRPATSGQTKKAALICAGIAVLTAFFAPIADAQWSAIPAFLPAYQTAIIIAYVITGYLIFAQYRVTRSLALLYLSGGCLYTGAILLAQFLSIPGLFAARGPLFGGSQTTIWLWCFWHVGPSAGILLYILTGRLKPGLVVERPKYAAGLFGAVLLLIFGASIASVTIFHDWLPILDVGGNFRRINSTGVAPAIQVLNGLALLALWRMTKFRTTLDVWLGVALFALFCDNLITMLGGERLSAGWYVGRINALVSAGVMLFVYLAEINRAYIKSMSDALQMAVSFAELEVKAEHARIDHLTGLASRALFLEQVAMSRAANDLSGTSAAVLFVDLDGFKAINDRFGHDHGDIVLTKTADVLRGALRQTDIAGRLGGDEFVVYLTAPSAAIDARAKQIAERIVGRIAEIGDGVGASVGIALYSQDDLEIDTVIRQADEAMYTAKRRGKNRFAFQGRPRLVAVP